MSIMYNVAAYDDGDGAAFRRWGKMNVIIMYSHHEMCSIRFPQSEMQTRIELSSEKNWIVRVKWQLSAMRIFVFFSAISKRNGAQKNKPRVISDQAPAHAYIREACEINSTNKHVSTRRYSQLETHTSIIIHIRHSFACKRTAYAGACSAHADTVLVTADSWISQINVHLHSPNATEIWYASHIMSYDFVRSNDSSKLICHEIEHFPWQICW